MIQIFEKVIILKIIKSVLFGLAFLQVQVQAIWISSLTVHKSRNFKSVVVNIFIGMDCFSFDKL